MPLNLTKINCITLKSRSKAEFMSKSQNISQQIILLCTTVMQMICAWPKIWTLSGRLFYGCVRFVFKLSPFWKTGCQKQTFIFMLICFIDIFCNDKAICDIFIVFKHWQTSANKIWRINIITIPLSRWRMFYTILNAYIFNSFKEPLATNSMAYLLVWFVLFMLSYYMFSRFLFRVVMSTTYDFHVKTMLG